MPQVWEENEPILTQVLILTRVTTLTLWRDNWKQLSISFEITENDLMVEKRQTVQRVVRGGCRSQSLKVRVGSGEEHGQKDWGAMPVWVPFLLQPSTSHTLETDILGSWKPNTLMERFSSTGTLFFVLFFFVFFFKQDYSLQN